MGGSACPNGDQALAPTCKAKGEPMWKWRPPACELDQSCRKGGNRPREWGGK